MDTISKKRKFVKEGVLYAELNEFLTRELAEDGYAGVKVRTTAVCTEIIISATLVQNVVGERGRRLKELTHLIQQRFQFPKDGVRLYAERVAMRALCAITQAESVRYKLAEGLPVRRACYGVLKYIMNQGAMGCEVIVTGKLRAQRAKAMKFKDGYMIKSGYAKEIYIDEAVRHLRMKQGVLGIKVRIQLPHDPTGQEGVATPLPDTIKINEPPKEDLELMNQIAAAPQQAPAPAGFEATPTAGGDMTTTPGGPTPGYPSEQYMTPQ
jgi:small subunit ribosomal protein S3e